MEVSGFSLLSSLGYAKTCVGLGVGCGIIFLKPIEDIYLVTSMMF